MVYEYESPVGTIYLSFSDIGIRTLSFHPIESTDGNRTHIAELTFRELNAYFLGNLKTFTIPLDPVGTPFQKLVWDALLKIPYGETRTYGQIADTIHHPKAFRAVGMACNRNPIGILVPCHRVVGATGSLTGYAGGLDKKEYLLALENNHKE